MRKYLLPEGGSFYKANLHCHTNISDGKLSPAEIKELYLSEGYSAVAYTDHDVMIPHHELTDERFVALTGVEYEINQYNSYPGKRGGTTTHLCFIAPTADTEIQPLWNERYAYVGAAPQNAARVKFDPDQPEYVRDFSPESVNATIKGMRDAGFFATHNHPCWSQEDASRYTQFEGLNAVEIYNGGEERLGIESYNPAFYDDVLRAGRRVFCVATDDNHNKHPYGTKECDSCRGYVMIKAPELSYDALMAALFKGDFYASRAPEIKELYVEDGRVYIKTSPAEAIYYKSALRRSAIVFAKDGEQLTEASFEVRPDDGSFRLTVKDKDGLTANTSAYFLDTLEGAL
ncbi:MAG: PHP domain-containing protein [Clostridia bacterium]|nr:PHP domain-containing protein [Clostridia bacterium]